MRLTIAGSIALAALAATGCARDADVAPPSSATDASAAIRDAGGRLVANASAAGAGDRLRVRVEAAGLAPGTYAAHIHMTGRCDPPGFDSAGAALESGSVAGMAARIRRASISATCPICWSAPMARGSFELGISGAELSGGPRALLDARRRGAGDPCRAGRLSHRPERQ